MNQKNSFFLLFGKRIKKLKIIKNKNFSLYCIFKKINQKKKKNRI